MVPTDTSAGHAIGVIVALGREAHKAPIKGANLRRINNKGGFVHGLPKSPCDQASLPGLGRWRKPLPEWVASAEGNDWATAIAGGSEEVVG